MSLPENAAKHLLAKTGVVRSSNRIDGPSGRELTYRSECGFEASGICCAGHKASYQGLPEEGGRNRMHSQEPSSEPKLALSLKTIPIIVGSALEVQSSAEELKQVGGRFPLLQTDKAVSEKAGKVRGGRAAVPKGLVRVNPQP